MSRETCYNCSGKGSTDADQTTCAVCLGTGYMTPQLCQAIAAQAALRTVPAIAEEIREKWDAGMKAGKLLIALIDPSLRYRSDITAIHEAAK